MLNLLHRRIERWHHPARRTTPLHPLAPPSPSAYIQDMSMRRSVASIAFRSSFPSWSRWSRHTRRSSGFFPSLPSDQPQGRGQLRSSETPQQKREARPPQKKIPYDRALPPTPTDPPPSGLERHYHQGGQIHGRREGSKKKEANRKRTSTEKRGEDT